jgi:hypothetical protein
VQPDVPIQRFAQQKDQLWPIGFGSSESRQAMMHSGRYDAFVQGTRELRARRQVAIKDD